MINFVQHVHTSQPKARPVDDRTVIPRTSSDHLAVTHRGMRIGRWSNGHPQAAVRLPAGDRAVIGRQPAGDLPTSEFAWHLPIIHQILTAS